MRWTNEQCVTRKHICWVYMRETACIGGNLWGVAGDFRRKSLSRSDIDMFTLYVLGFWIARGIRISHISVFTHNAPDINNQITRQYPHYTHYNGENHIWYTHLNHNNVWLMKRSKHWRGCAKLAFLVGILLDPRLAHRYDVWCDLSCNILVTMLIWATFLGCDTSLFRTSLARSATLGDEVGNSSWNLPDFQTSWKSRDGVKSTKL